VVPAFESVLDGQSVLDGYEVETTETLVKKFKLQ